MAGRIGVRLVLTGSSVVALSSCSLLPNSITHREPESTHTMQDLCNFPKEFVTNTFHAQKLEVRPEGPGSPPMDRKLGHGDLCWLTNVSPVVVTAVGMDYSRTPEHSNPGTTRTWTIDGVPVQEVPSDQHSSTSTAGPSITLKATIDRWTGTFIFNSDNESTIKAAAEMLVNMVRTLKN